MVAPSVAVIIVTVAVLPAVVGVMVMVGSAHASLTVTATVFVSAVFSGRAADKVIVVEPFATPVTYMVFPDLVTVAILVLSEVTVTSS